MAKFGPGSLPDPQAHAQLLARYLGMQHYGPAPVQVHVHTQPMGQFFPDPSTQPMSNGLPRDPTAARRAESLLQKQLSIAQAQRGPQRIRARRPR